VIEEKLPTRLEAAWFQLRASCFRLKRGVVEWNGRAPARLRRAAPRNDARQVAESRTVLFNSASPAEFALQAGKVQNLRVAAAQLNGLVIPAGQVFSFWKNMGRATRRRGFVAGRELREGCVIPNIGGGLCQLSNALYDVALRAGCDIVERHAHSERLPGSITAPGRDATIFWNYVDLRFRPPFDCQLRVELSRGELRVALEAPNSAPTVTAAEPALASCETRIEVVETCETCGVSKCFRNPAATSLPRHGTTAWLLDKYEPEFDRWIGETHNSEDAIFVPVNSRRIASYRWNTNRFCIVRQARLSTLHRSWRSRQLARQGAERQRALLEFDRALAQDFANKIPHLADQLVVSQNLLPHLWRSGQLGGRTFDVLMTRLPIDALETILDQVAAMHPESVTLKDYRAAAEIRDAEIEALAAARFWVTPHSQVADIGKERAIKLDWISGTENRRTPAGRSVVFPASTLGRKGCYEMRDVAQRLKINLQVVGAVIERADFWAGTDVSIAPHDWLDHAALVVLPAWVEHWPRRLLQAAAAGVPVIATEACGLRGIPNVIEIPLGDRDALHARVEETLNCIRA
jgi:hypothetical protein